MSATDSKSETHLDRLHEDGLRSLGFSRMRIDNRHRFGWRYWELSEEGHLRSPYAHGGSIRTPIIRSACSNGHTPPHPNCTCGIYYVPSWFPFYETVRALDWTKRLQLDRVALTFGVALDGVELDPSRDRWVMKPRRTGRYRILGILSDATLDGELAGFHHCPVLRGINDQQAYLLEKSADLNAPDDFGEFRQSCAGYRETAVAPDNAAAVAAQKHVTIDVSDAPWRK